MRNPEPRVVERRARPPCRGVTVLTGGLERRRRVIGAGRGVIVLLVTRHARRALAGVHAVTVALQAGDGAVLPSQGEASGIVIEAGVGPDGRRMARTAVLREPPRDVVGVLGRLELRQVTLDALRRQIHERQSALWHRRVALLAVDGEMRPAQRKPCQLMDPHHDRAVEKVAGRVTAGAVRAELTMVDILVTRRAVARRAMKVERRMTGPARGLSVRSDKREALLRVIEFGADARGGPRFRAVAHGALFLQFAVRVLCGLLRARGRAPEPRQDDGKCEGSPSHDPLLTVSPWHVSHLPDRGR